MATLFVLLIAIIKQWTQQMTDSYIRQIGTPKGVPLGESDSIYLYDTEDSPVTMAVKPGVTFPITFNYLFSLETGYKVVPYDIYDATLMLIDDRLRKSKWHHLQKKVDIFILEGWCVGARPEKNFDNLKKPINKLEALEDKNCKWRLKVNQHLKTDYKELFSFIDLMIYLKVPNFNKVLAWRGLQEKKLAYSKKNMSQNKLKIMTESEIKRFIMFYERITKKMLIDMPKFADIIVPISSNHQPKKIILN